MIFKVDKGKNKKVGFLALKYYRRMNHVMLMGKGSNLQIIFFFLQCTLGGKRWKIGSCLLEMNMKTVSKADMMG